MHDVLEGVAIMHSLHLYIPQLRIFDCGIKFMEILLRLYCWLALAKFHDSQEGTE